MRSNGVNCRSKNIGTWNTPQIAGLQPLKDQQGYTEPVPLPLQLALLSQQAYPSQQPKTHFQQLSYFFMKLEGFPPIFLIMKDDN
jgi:hypothetical protein